MITWKNRFEAQKNNIDKEFKIKDVIIKRLE